MNFYEHSRTIILHELLAFYRSNRTLSLSVVQIFYFPIVTSSISGEFTEKMLIGYREKREICWRDVRLRGNEGFLNRSTGCASVRTFYVSERCSSFHVLPFPLRFHIELHTRKSFGSGFEGARYKFDVDMDMESNISGYLVSSSCSRRSSSGRTFFRLSQCSFR